MAVPPHIAGYDLEEPIGAGGMGEVWKARHRLLARPVAIKVIRPSAEVDERSRQRFVLEAQVTAALESPHSVAVYDFGVSDDGSLFFAMELLHGIDLQQLVERFGPLAPERAVHLLDQACKSLQDAHLRGLIHHDVKPSNIMATRVGTQHDFVKLLDFGLVRAIGCDRDKVTTPRGVAGTPAFLAPEVVSSTCAGECDVDGCADIYALGCVAYWLLTGKLVFDAATAEKMAIEHVLTAPTPPSFRAEHPIPTALDALVLDCLAKDPAQRPQTASEVASRLRAVSFSHPWTPSRAREWWLLHAPTAQESPRDCPRR